MFITKRGLVVAYIIAFLLWIPGITYRPQYPFWNFIDAAHQWPWFIAGTSLAVWAYTKWEERQDHISTVHPYTALRHSAVACKWCKERNMDVEACKVDRGYCIWCCSCEGGHK